MARLLLLAPLLITACASAPSSADNPEAPPVPPHPVRWPTAEGSIIRLAPATATPHKPTDDFIEGLWRETLRQSPRFDVAGPNEGAESMFEVRLHRDVAAATMTTTLVREGQAPVPLASAKGETSAAIDTIALRTRQALGELVDTWPLPCVAIYSSDRQCVELTERAQAATMRGDWPRSLELLRRARARDSGSTVTLAALAKALSVVGNSQRNPGMMDESHRVAVEALTLDHRLAATTKHRLAHIAIVARSRTSGRGPESDRELLSLSDAVLRERPHDPNAALTRAIALNFMTRYTESAPLLRELSARWPSSPEVAYHLAFAELAEGDAEAALSAIRRTTGLLPREQLVVPTALALFHADHQTELRKMLTELADSSDFGTTRERHSLQRMRAAHAILTDRLDDAVRVLLEDLEWIRQRPSLLESNALDVAESGEVLVLIGRHADLRPVLQAFEELGDLPPTFSQTMVYLGGLVQVAQGSHRAEVAEAHLTTSGQTVWSSMVRAAAHQRRGELMDELKERVLQYQSTESPLPRASLARVLEAAGSHDRALQVLEQLRAQLLSFDLRGLSDHPLMRPAAALAFLATKSLPQR